MALAINNDNFESLKNDSKPLVVDFWAEWCGPCRMVAPIVEELAAEYEGRVNIGKCDVDNNDDLVAMFRIRNIPTLLFLKGGEIVDKHVGAISKNDLKAKIEALL
ncbi:MAG: thioredoxin [Alistipes sp.]